MAGRHKKTQEVAVVETRKRVADPPKHRRGPQTGSDNARRGGMAVRDKYGQEFFARIGALGGQMVRQLRGPDFYATIGRMGGQATRDSLGIQHYERIGRMGGLRTRRHEREAEEAEHQAQQETP